MTDDDMNDSDANADGLGATTRRQLLTASVAIAAGGLGGFKYGHRSVEAATGANSIGTQANPMEQVFTDRIQLVDNNRALSNNGDFRYNP